MFVKTKNTKDKKNCTSRHLSRTSVQSMIHILSKKNMIEKAKWIDKISKKNIDSL